MRNFRQSENGQGIVEIAIVLPILLMIILGIFDFGRAFYSYLTLEHASREAARYASILAADGDVGLIRAKAVENASGVNVNSGNVAVTYATEQGHEFVTVSFSYSMDFYTPVLLALNPFSFPSVSSTMRVEGVSP